MSAPRPKLSLPGEKAYGPTSPIIQVLCWITEFLARFPQPNIGTNSAKSNALLVGNHLLHLISGCGLLNGSGLHSAAVTLLRPMEDALDCFAAVVLIEGAAEQWAKRQLKPSDAAKQWTARFLDLIQPQGTSLPEYRKYLRGEFAKYSHCSHDLCLWDLFFKPQIVNDKTGKMQGTLELNFVGHVIDLNAHAIDAYLTAHLLEFIELIKVAYSGTLQSEPTRMKKLIAFEKKITEIMEKHNQHRCQEVRVPPEVARIES